MSDLTVLTVVENDKGLLDLMVRSLRKFSDTMPNLIICDNGRNGDVLSKYDKDSNIKIVQFNPGVTGGSNRHGYALNRIFPLVKTPKTAIVESDCIVLRNGWDTLESPHRIVASPKSAGLYHVCFMLFETRLLRGVDFRAGKDGNRANRPYKAKEDVGWQVGSFVREDELHAMEFRDCKTGTGKYFDDRFQSDEFWLDGRPTVAHFGRGSNIGGKAVRKGFKSPKEQLIEWKKKAEEIIK